MLIDIYIKFREYSLCGCQVIERTRFVTDRQTDRQTDRRTDGQTDGQTDGRPGKNNMSPDPEGGRHKKSCAKITMKNPSYWPMNHTTNKYSPVVEARM